MSLSLETLAAIATIVGTVMSILALLDSKSWLVISSTAVVCLSIAAILYARKERLKITAAATVIEGYSIDSLNVANLRRSVNRSFVIQDALHTARIRGDDLELSWRYSGLCRTANEAAFEFSIHADANTTFDQLHCVAFDLTRDPDMAHEIRPVLIGAEGISKKISVPFLEPVKSQQPFSVILRCTLPGCMRQGFGYYTSTFSFIQDRVERSEVRLVFDGPAPSWVRVYERTPKEPPALVKSLRVSREGDDLCEYVDLVEGRRGQSTRVYVFWRDSV